MKRELSDIQKIRHRNVRSLINELGNGGPSRFAEILGKKTTHTSQFASENPNRGISEKMARVIEEKFGIEKYSLDRDSLVVKEPAEPQSSSMDHGRLLNAAKWARQTELLFNKPLSPVAHAQFVIDLYENGTDQKSKADIAARFKSDDGGRAIILEAGQLAHKIFTSLKKEMGSSFNEKDESKYYAEILADVLKELIDNGKDAAEASREIISNRRQ